MRLGPLTCLSFIFTVLYSYLDYCVMDFRLTRVEWFTVGGKVHEEQVQTPDHEMILAGGGRVWRGAEYCWL